MGNQKSRRVRSTCIEVYANIKICKKVLFLRVVQVCYISSTALSAYLLTLVKVILKCILKKRLSPESQGFIEIQVLLLIDDVTRHSS